MSLGIGNAISSSFKKKGIDFRSYWATLISATVETAAPTHVVLTFPTAQTSLLATDITATVNGVARAVSSASWTGAAWTVVLASAVDYADTVVMTFVKTGQTANVTNNVLSYAALLTSTGTGAGVSTLRIQVSSNITVTLGANAKFYSDAGGTADESAIWLLTSGAVRTIYLKCTTGTATMTFSDVSKLINFGQKAISDGWVSGQNAAILTLDIGKFINLVHLGINAGCTINGIIPVNLDSISLTSNTSTYTHNSSYGKLTYVFVSGNLYNWISLDGSGSGNITTFQMLNYRIAKMSSADMVTLLTSLTNRVGNLPASIVINDYTDYASPPAEVVAAVNLLKTTKSVTTVTLGA